MKYLANLERKRAVRLDGNTSLRWKDSDGSKAPSPGIVNFEFDHRKQRSVVPSGFPEGSQDAGTITMNAGGKPFALPVNNPDD